MTKCNHSWTETICHFVNSITFSIWLKDEMEKRGWNQAELARRSGVSRQVISRYINQQRVSPNKNILAKIAKALDYPKEIVLAAAGILDPFQAEIAEAKKFNHILRELTPAERDELYQIGLLKIERRRQEELKRKGRGDQK